MSILLCARFNVPLREEEPHANKLFSAKTDVVSGRSNNNEETAWHMHLNLNAANSLFLSQVHCTPIVSLFPASQEAAHAEQ